MMTTETETPVLGMPLVQTPQMHLEAPGQHTMAALDEDVQGNLCCPHVLSNVLSCICFPTWLGSINTIQQNEHAAVMVWGKYVGSLTQPGMNIVNPIGTELRKVSTARQTMNVQELKVVDARGNPIMISGNIAYQIYSVRKSRVDVQDAFSYVHNQAPMVLRKVASQYNYDTLRIDHDGQVQAALQSYLQAVVADAGVKIMKFDLTDLSYAPEIAQSMLVKQQAEAMIEARRLITSSAVSIACDAAKQVKSMGHEISKETEEALIKNVLTVICSHNGVTPTVAM